MSRAAKRALALLASLAAGAVALETLLHLVPGLLPECYLAGFPANGCEFFEPDVFNDTPVEGVLLPHRAAAFRGPPPADLIELGVAPPGIDDDARAFPEVELPADALGFPNAEERERWDLVLVGDSFGVSAGALRPEGLQAMLARATGLVVENLSLAGIGPAQERWLLESLALDGMPRAVLWLWFSGNDLTASYEPFLARHEGKTTWAEAWPERRKPRLYLPALLGAALAPPPAAGPEPLPPFVLHAADGAPLRVWFHPDHLAQLAWSGATWEAHPVWAPVQAELRAARDACARAGVRLVLVYLPSKPEILLPHVDPDPALELRTVSFQGRPAPPEAPETAHAQRLANRHAQEELLRSFCTAESIPFLSAVPALEAQAARGELGYLVTDTHWQSRGHAALLEPLLAFLRAEGVLP